jgi:hypothetical protein
MRGTSTRLKACNYCRAHRLRCDRVKREPEPCSSCRDRRLGCTFTVTTRLAGGPRIQRGLRNARNLSGQATALGETPPVLQAHNEGADVFSVHSPTSVETHHIDIEEYCGDSQKAGSVVVSARDINQTFRYFFQSMHPHFPFLNPVSFSIARTLDVSPLLFWTVMAIANNFRNRPLYEGLQTFVRGLVAEVLYPSGHGIETCQALCLLCLWPLEGHDPNDEPVYLYAELLTHLAMRTGLHRAEWQHEYKNINELVVLNKQHSIHDKVNTWAACIFVEHHHACKNGIPSGVRQDWPMRLKLLSPRTFHPIVKNIVTLCFIQDRYLNSLAFEGNTPSGLLPPKERIGHLKLFSAALDDFQVANPPLDIQSAIFLQFTRVMVGGLCLARELQTELLLRGECCSIVSAGLTAAVAILDLMAPLAWETLPTHMLRAVLYAGVFAAQLLRLRSSPPLLVEIDIVTILRRAVDIMRHLAYGHDFATRSKIILETELQKHTAQEVETPI